MRRLTEAGYRFHDNTSEQTAALPFRHDTDRAAEVLDWLHREFDAIPTVLESWLRIVGDVSCAADHVDR